MGYPCYKIKNEREYNYIKQCLKMFGYDTGTIDPYKKFYNLIVLNSDGRFGIIDNVPFKFNDRFSRYLVNTIDEFLSIAAELKNATFKPRKNNKINMENNKPQTKEPKIGDIVLVKNTDDENYVQRIYLGTYKNKYITVYYNTSNDFKECCEFKAIFWDEMVTRVTVTKTQVAERFGVSIDMLEIVD